MKFNMLKNMETNFKCPAIELYGNKRIIILDCKCVIDYSQDTIVLDLGDVNLKIRGSNLVANSFAFGQTDINGDIISLEFV